jgi:hypothetical protein
MGKIKWGISPCLLGMVVRYDASHKPKALPDDGYIRCPDRSPFRTAFFAWKDLLPRNSRRVRERRHREE